VVLIEEEEEEEEVTKASKVYSNKHLLSHTSFLGSNIQTMTKFPDINKQCIRK
jgi:carbamoylphosphate synthase large subunit